MRGVQQLLAFAQTARSGSFAAAARDVGASPSTLAKSVGRLEASLGLKLFHRTTRRVTLTADGERLFHRCERVLAEFEELQAEASGARATPAGTVRLDLPVFYGRRFVLPILAELRRRHPALVFEVRLQDGFADLVRDGLDLAVRTGELRDSSLVARRVDTQGLALVASPAHLRRHGTPMRLEALAGHPAIVFRMPTSGRNRPWQFRHGRRSVELHAQHAIQLDDTEALGAAAREGLGLCQLPDYIVENDLASGALVEVLADHRPPPMPISAVVPSGRFIPPRVRVVIEALEALQHRQRGRTVAKR